MKIQYKYLPFITALYVTISQVAYVTAYKIVDTGILILPAGILAFPLIYTLADVVSEVYGYKRIRRMLWEAAFCGFLFTSTIFLFIHLPSPSNWTQQAAYNITLNKICRIYFSIIIGVTLGSFVNIYLISKWKILVHGRIFWLRSFTSTAIGEAVITIIVDSLAFFGIMPIYNLGSMMLSIFIYKAIYAFIAAIPATFLVNFLKNKEGLDVYDHGTNFNPFKLDIDLEEENNYAIRKSES